MHGVSGLCSNAALKVGWLIGIDFQEQVASAFRLLRKKKPRR